MNKLKQWTVMSGLAIASVLGFSHSRAISGVFYPNGATTMHFAFEGSPNGDRPIVRAPAFYHADDGFGFVDSPALIGTARSVTAPRYFRFDVNVPDGNYDVSAMLGGVPEESLTTIKAEGHRAMVLDARATRNQSVPRTFTVNVRHGSAGSDDSNTPPDMDGRLNLEFVGTNPSLMKLDIKPNEKAITVYVVGEQTTATTIGWGQMLSLLFKPSEVAIAPTGEKQLNEIAGVMKTGDCILMQVSSSQPDQATSKKTLQAVIEQAGKRQAAVVLLTTPANKKAAGTGTSWLGDFAKEQKVALIDLNTKGAEFSDKIGAANSAKVFADETHLTAYGALEFAKLVALAIQEQKLDLATHLADNIASNFDPAQFPADLGMNDAPVKP